jgi:hypothetical protein
VTNFPVSFISQLEHRTAFGRFFVQFLSFLNDIALDEKRFCVGFYLGRKVEKFIVILAENKKNKQTNKTF